MTPPSSSRAGAGRRLTTAGGSTLLVVAALVLLAPWLIRSDPAAQLDPVAGASLPPLTCRFLVRLGNGSSLVATRWRETAGGIEIQRRGSVQRIGAAELASRDPAGAVTRRCFPLGTDRLGRDVTARLLHGGRVSLAIGLGAALLAALLGTAVGVVAGGAGGWIDTLLMRGVDGLMAFPRLFLVIAAAAFLPLTPWLVIAVLAGTGWMGTARLVRGEVRSLLGRPFVEAARATGLGPARLYVRHLLPNSITPALVDLTSRTGDIILAEAALSYLGLGVQPPVPSWGNMIAEGSISLSGAWWTTALPGVAILITVLALNLLGDGLTERLDPRRA